MSTDTRQYNVWQDEDGDYFGEGHIPPEDFRAACLAWDKEYGIDQDSDEGCGEMDTAGIKHEWWRHQYPDNDEAMERCEPTDSGAMPFTAWRR